MVKPSETKEKKNFIDLRLSCLGNQRLDFQEFVAFMSKHWHERDQEAELRDAFRLFDRDNSGYITINELKQVGPSACTSNFSHRFLFFSGYVEHGRKIESGRIGRYDERSERKTQRKTPSTFFSFRPTSIAMANSIIKVIHHRSSCVDHFSILEFVQKLLSTS